MEVFTIKEHRFSHGCEEENEEVQTRQPLELFRIKDTIARITRHQKGAFVLAQPLDNPASSIQGILFLAISSRSRPTSDPSMFCWQRAVEHGRVRVGKVVCVVLVRLANNAWRHDRVLAPTEDPHLVLGQVLKQKKRGGKMDDCI